MTLSTSDLSLLTLYFGILLPLSIYGGHRCLLAYRCLRHRRESGAGDAAGRRGSASSSTVELRSVTAQLPSVPAQLPSVTVQLPLFNERCVVERVLVAVAALEYPRERLQIQVLDDSTDDTRELAAAAVARLRSTGVPIEHLWREKRDGFKAGALEAGLADARGELIAIFDADFVPDPGLLLRLVPHFDEPRIGMVQARWSHLNREDSLLTEVQGLLLDAHFIVEHTARHRSGCFFNFNGTAGVWRREAIDDAGGWQHDTLTEDLDLSYRAQRRGWRFVYLPEVTVPAELPGDIEAFKSQQRRWAKGSVQTARKQLRAVLREPLPLRVRTEAFFHLTANLSYPLMVLLAAVMPAATLLRSDAGLESVVLVDLPIFLAAMGALVFFYSVSQLHEPPRVALRRLARLPLVLAVGAGLCLSNARAVLEAFGPTSGEFTRTPKTGGGLARRPAPGLLADLGHIGRGYAGRASWLWLLELLFALYYVGAVLTAVRAEAWGSLPFLGLFLLGFGYVGGLSAHAALVSRARARTGEPVSEPSKRKGADAGSSGSLDLEKLAS